MDFFFLIETAFSSVLYGIVTTAVIMAILYIILKNISKSIVQTPVFYIVGVILAFLLVSHTSLMIGAIQAKDATDAAEIYLRQLFENKYGIISAQESQRVIEAITEKFPIIYTFINLADFSGNDFSNLPKTIHDTMIEYLNSYIWRRVWWSLGFIVTACVIVMLYDKRALTTTGKTKRKVTMASRKNYDDF